MRRMKPPPTARPTIIGNCSALSNGPLHPLYGSEMVLSLWSLQNCFISVTSNININKKRFKCNVCGLELPDEKRLENHRKVHFRKKKSKVYEYGDPYLDYLGKQGIQAGFR